MLGIPVNLGTESPALIPDIMRSWDESSSKIRLEGIERLPKFYLGRQSGQFHATTTSSLMPLLRSFLG